MPLFEIPTRAGVAQDMLVAKKAKSKTAKKTTTTVKSGGLAGQIQQIVRTVDVALGQYADDYICIQDKDTLHQYLQECRGNGYLSIDTETTGLNPIRDKIAGICIYTYGQHGAYIPINHVNYFTEELLPNQLPQDFVVSEFSELLKYKPSIDMFNAPFDIRFMRAFGITETYCTWDASIGSRLMNENEPESQRGLKPLHNKYVLGGKGDAFAYDDLFKKIPFIYIPLRTATLYAGHDPVITTEYCDFQRQHLTYNPDEPKTARNGMNGVAWVFQNIEMPIVNVVVDMENTGVEIDLEYNKQLVTKYHTALDANKTALQAMCDEYEVQLGKYKKDHPKTKLDIPINFGSPSQLAILLYDIIGLDAGVDKRTKKPIRGTGEDILKTLDHPICKAILEYRALEKLVGTYIDKLPNCVEPSDGRIHCKFNQYGADTGRFSSSDPNLQNIPSHNKDIRKMFKASDGYVMMSSDFSQQEPKCLAALCRQQGDPQMYNTFMQGKDLYSEIASVSFHRDYKDCLEFYLDENGNKTEETNKEGKAYRSQAKSILLGVLYGRGTDSVAEQLGCSTDEAQSIKDSVFQGFPAIKKFEDDSLAMAKELGYVTTVCGRKRRLPDLQLPEYEFKWKSGYSNPYEDPLDFDSILSDEVPDDLCDYFWDKLINAKYKKTREKVIAEADAQGIEIIDNRTKIGNARRQCVNARIQGSAADLTKLAMIDLYNNERLKELGFKMLIPVHDEIIAECPEENAKECAELLAKTMSDAAEKILEMPIKCDVEVTRCWYGERVEIA